MSTRNNCDEPPLTPEEREKRVKNGSAEGVIMDSLQVGAGNVKKTRRKSQSGLTYADVPDDGGYGAQLDQLLKEDAKNKKPAQDDASRLQQLMG